MTCIPPRMVEDIAIHMFELSLWGSLNDTIGVGLISE